MSSVNVHCSSPSILRCISLKITLFFNTHILTVYYDLKRQFLSGYKNLKAQICNKKMSFWNFLAKNSKIFFIIPRHSPSPMELIHTLKTIFIAIKMVKMA